MNRREFCAALAAATAGSLAGCRGIESAASDPSTPEGESVTPDEEKATPTPTGDGTATPAEPTATREAVGLAGTGFPASICDASVVEGFNITEIVDPAFASDWTGHDIDPQYLRDESTGGLTDEATIVGRVAGGSARAYPVSVLWHHEIVNDTHGLPLIVTYCSICRSGMVARRVVDGEPTRFGVSGQLWRPPDRFIPASEEAGTSFGANRWNGTDVNVRDGANLVMYDELTGSFWSQALARAICGPAKGTTLEIVPSELATWGEWRADHPDTEILLPPPHSSVDLDS